MSFKTLMMGMVFCLVCSCAFSQGGATDGKKYFFDTLTIMDYNTYEESVMESRLFKPINRKFYLKNDQVNYQLFSGKVASMNQEQFFNALKEGFSLYIDKREHKQHLNLKPSILEIVSESGEVVESLEDIYGKDATKLNAKIQAGTTVKLSGFIISVNERKHGRIIMDVLITE